MRRGSGGELRTKGLQMQDLETAPAEPASPLASPQESYLESRRQLEASQAMVSAAMAKATEAGSKVMELEERLRASVGTGRRTQP